MKVDKLVQLFEKRSYSSFDGNITITVTNKEYKRISYDGTHYLNFKLLVKFLGKPQEIKEQGQLVKYFWFLDVIYYKKKSECIISIFDPINQLKYNLASVDFLTQMNGVEMGVNKILQNLGNIKPQEIEVPKTTKPKVDIE